MKYRLQRAVTALVILAATTSLASAATITNGSFNDGTNASLNGWTASGNVGAINEHFYDQIQGVAQPGSNFWAVFGGGQQPGGSISQTFATVAGAVYNLSFTYGGWGDTSPQSLDFSVGGLAATVSATASELTKDWATIAAHTYTFSFTAGPGSTSTLLFSDASGSSINADGVLTKVSVTAVPGPEAGAGIGAFAMAGLALYLKRRRKAEVLVA